MHFTKTLVASLLLLFALPVVAQRSMDDPMTRAVMESYSQMLTANPKDYQVYFRRANEYYNHNMMAEALADVDAALQNTPEKEKDMRFQCLCLRASILESMHHYDRAVADLDAALAISPNNYTELYHKANCEFTLGRYDAAKATFQKLQRLNSRSQEALFGLGRVAAAEGNAAQANKYIDDAIDLTPADPAAYQQRADIRAMMGNIQGATDDYATSITLASDRNLQRPLRALVDMSYVDYNAVINGLSQAISRSPRQGVFYYIRGVISQAHFRYTSAVSDYRYLLDNNLLDFAGIYRKLGECLYALGAYDEALGYIDDAIGSSADNIEAFVVKSDIKRALGTARQAVTAADRALAKDSTYAPAYVAKALAFAEQNLKIEASVASARAALLVPSDPYCKMLRAWILADFTDQPEEATQYYNEVLGLETYPTDALGSLRGFALLFTDRAAEGNQWIETVLAENANNPDGEAEYFAACYYAQAGDLDKAFDCMERSLKKGYADLNNWQRATGARIDVAPLRNDPRFTDLLNRYHHIFNL